MRVRLNVRKTTKGGKEYTTYYITLPKDIVESLTLSTVRELELRIQEVNGKLAIVLTKP